MKWKDWFVSTLPRSKKSRRKSTPTVSKHSDPLSGSLSSPETDDVIIHNQRLQADVINGNSKKKKKRPASCHNSRNKNCEKLTQISCNRQLVSPDFQYVGDQTYGYNTLTKTSSNASESGFEDGYDHHSYPNTEIKWCYEAPSPPECEQPDLLPCLNHTFPRQRTRIKTNPWVSSRSGTSSMATSYNSDVMTSSCQSDVMTSSMQSDGMSSSLTSDEGHRSPHHGMCTPPFYHQDYENNTLPAPLTPNRNWNNGNYRSCTDSEDTSDTDWFGQSRSYPYEDNGNVYSQDDLLEDKEYSPHESGVVEGSDLVINLKTGNIFVKQSKPVFSAVSFQYEDDLDATLEKEISRRKKRSAPHKVHPVEDNDDTPHCSDREQEYGQSGTLTKSSSDNWAYDPSKVKTFRKRSVRKHDRSPEEKVLFYESINRTEVRKTDCHGNSDIMYETSYQREGTDSAYDSSTLSSLAGSSFHGPSIERPMTLPSSVRSKHMSCESESRRSLEEIHCSLKQKVERLRAEKRIVDEKVKQAMEEDEMKREEKAKIQKEVSSLRKQVLLKTLQDLKENLETQNSRLQEAYDDVLDMQWLNAKLRRMRNTTI